MKQEDRLERYKIRLNELQYRLNDSKLDPISDEYKKIQDKIMDLKSKISELNSKGIYSKSGNSIILDRSGVIKSYSVVGSRAYLNRFPKNNEELYELKSRFNKETNPTKKDILALNISAFELERNYLNDLTNILTRLKNIGGRLFSDSMDKCPADGCIQKKPNGKWGVISNKTGKFWKANYDSEEDAKKGLEAYHAQKGYAEKLPEESEKDYLRRLKSYSYTIERSNYVDPDYEKVFIDENVLRYNSIAPFFISTYESNLSGMFDCILKKNELFLNDGKVITLREGIEVPELKGICLLSNGKCYFFVNNNYRELYDGSDKDDN